MTENIIYYSICVFFSVIGLGMTWTTRSRYIQIKAFVVILASIAVVTSYIYWPSLLGFLDARVIWSWVSEKDNIDGRLRAMVVLLLFIGVACYFVLIEHLLLKSFSKYRN